MKTKMDKIPNLYMDYEDVFISNNTIKLYHRSRANKTSKISIENFKSKLINTLDLDLDYLVKNTPEEIAFVYVDEYGNMEAIDPIKHIEYKEDIMIIKNGTINIITGKDNQYEISVYDNFDLYVVNVESLDYEILKRLGRNKLIKAEIKSSF